MDGDAEIGKISVQALPEEEISLEETELAGNLHCLCDRFGMELKEKVEDSADVLFSLGKLYFNKAHQTVDMLQKLTYIRCSALLNGAKVRFRMGLNFSKIGEVDEALVKLHSSIIHSASITGVGGAKEMLDFSMKLLDEIKGWRKDARERIDNIPKVDKDVNIEKQNEKSEKVKSLNLKNTEQYMDLVNKISTKVEELLGTPPCQFAIVGLGSLARQEITLYSDFEHVIVLDDKVQQKNDDELQAIKEYFRWFSVIFQVIMIGFGETFIPSVGVKSLNDHYTSDKSKNWFYDAYTPRGIAFDGMVPYSCNTPLGRQQATKERKHAVELIQPASEMVKFLALDEKIKNGYYLHNILASTCFVYGSDEVYKVYSMGIGEILDAQSPQYILEREEETIYQNCNEAIWNMSYAIDHQKKYDIKTELYRPITTLVGCYGRMNDITDECTSFGIILRLWEDETITWSFRQELTYAVAVACEARLRIYALTGSERNAMTMKRYAFFVGKESALLCSKAIFDLKFAIAGKTYPEERDLPRRGRPPRPHHPIRDCINLKQKAKDLMNYGYFEESIHLSTLVVSRCKEIAQRNPSPDVLTTIMDAKCVMLKSFLHLGSEQNEYLMMCEQICFDMFVRDNENTAGRYRPTCVQTLCRVYASMTRAKEFTEMFEMLKRYYNGFNFPAEKSSGSQGDLFIMRFDDFKMRQVILGWDKMLKYLQKELEGEDEMNSQFLLRCHIAIVQIRLGQIETGRKDLLRVLTEIIENAQCIGKSAYIALLKVIATEQSEQGWKYDHSIAFLEEHQVKQTTVMAGDDGSVPSGLEEEDHRLHGKICRWRRKKNLPLENYKLNIWDEYERMSPYSSESNEKQLLKSVSDKATLMYLAFFYCCLLGNFEKAAELLSNIYNNERADLKPNLSQLQTHVSYCEHSQSKLRDIRDFHTKTLPIEGSGRLVSKYNEAADNLFFLKIPESADGLWSILQNADEKEHYIWRQALALAVFMLQRKARRLSGGNATSLQEITSAPASQSSSTEQGLQKRSSPESVAAVGVSHLDKLKIPESAAERNIKATQVKEKQIGLAETAPLSPTEASVINETTIPVVVSRQKIKRRQTTNEKALMLGRKCRQPHLMELENLLTSMKEEKSSCKDIFKVFPGQKCARDTGCAFIMAECVAKLRGVELETQQPLSEQALAFIHGVLTDADNTMRTQLTINCTNDICKIYFALSKYSEAVDFCERGIELLKGTEGINGICLGDLQQNAGFACASLYDLSTARSYYLQARESYKKADAHAQVEAQKRVQLLEKRLKDMDRAIQLILQSH